MQFIQSKKIDMIISYPENSQSYGIEIISVT